MSGVHTYGLFVMAKGRWHSLRAVCRPGGMKMWLHTNHEVDEDEVDNWRVWVMDDYEERTGLEIIDE